MPTHWRKSSARRLNKLVLLAALAGLIGSFLFAKRFDRDLGHLILLWGGCCAAIGVYAIRLIIFPINWELVLDTQGIRWGPAGKQTRIQKTDIKRIVYTTGDTNDSLTIELNDTQKINLPFSGNWGFVKPDAILFSAMELGIPTEKVVV